MEKSRRCECGMANQKLILILVQSLVTIIYAYQSTLLVASH